MSAKYVSLILITSFQNSIVPKTGHTLWVSSQAFHKGSKPFRSIISVNAFYMYISVCFRGNEDIWNISFYLSLRLNLRGGHQTGMYPMPPSGHKLWVACSDSLAIVLRPTSFMVHFSFFLTSDLIRASIHGYPSFPLIISEGINLFTAVRKTVLNSIQISLTLMWVKSWDIKRSANALMWSLRPCISARLYGKTCKNKNININREC